MKKNFLAVLFALALCSPTFAQWKPAGDKIKTPWGEQLNPKNVLPEYPTNCDASRSGNCRYLYR